MVKGIKFFAALVLIGILTAGLVTGCGGPSGTVKYSIKEKGFALELPKSWSTQNGNGNVYFIGVAPKDSSDDSFSENLNVVVEDLAEDITDGNELLKLAKEFIAARKDVKLESSGLTTVSGLNGAWITMSQKMGDEIMTITQYMVTHSKKIYVITCAYSQKQAAKYTPVYQQIVSSFKLGQ